MATTRQQEAEKKNYQARPPLIAHVRSRVLLIRGEGGELATSLHGNWWNNAISINFNGDTLILDVYLYDK